MQNEIGGEWGGEDKKTLQNIFYFPNENTQQ